MLRLVDVAKQFGSCVAVRRASLEVPRGKILAVCGENGAGKSTLLKMGAGVLRPDSGQVLIDGRALVPHTAREAIERGVGMVQQHFALVGALTALENVVLGVEPVRGGGVLDLEAARARMAKILAELGTDLRLDERVERLGVGDRQRLEIARILYRDAKVLILDEPTAVLTPGEADALYGMLRRLAEAGRSVVVVTHKLDEVRAHADEVVVLRRGENVLAKKLDGDRAAIVREIAAAVMGGEPPAESERKKRELGDVMLELEDVRVERGLTGLSLRVRGSEIVGVAGVEGNGQSELAEVLGGLRAPDAGTVRGGPIEVVHQDRQRHGLVLDAPVRENLVLGELGRFSRHGWLDKSAMDEEAARRFASAHVKGGLDDAARDLSGGNQQKVVLARALGRKSKVLVLLHPTRGVDLGAARGISDAIVAAADEGAAVLLVSADLHELRSSCDRILVLARGKIVAELAPTASDEEIGRAMLSAGGRDAA